MVNDNDDSSILNIGKTELQKKPKGRRLSTIERAKLFRQGIPPPMIIWKEQWILTVL